MCLRMCLRKCFLLCFLLVLLLLWSSNVFAQGSSGGFGSYSGGSSGGTMSQSTGSTGGAGSYTTYSYGGPVKYTYASCARKGLLSRLFHRPASSSSCSSCSSGNCSTGNCSTGNCDNGSCGCGGNCGGNCGMQNCNCPPNTPASGGGHYVVIDGKYVWLYDPSNSPAVERKDAVPSSCTCECVCPSCGKHFTCNCTASGHGTYTGHLPVDDGAKKEDSTPVSKDSAAPPKI